MTRPVFEPGRYITLMGDPIGPQGPKPFFSSLPGRTEVQVAVGAIGLTSLFNELAVQATDLVSEEVAEIAMTSVVVGGNLFGIAVLRAVERSFCLSRNGFDYETIATKCVDTKPDSQTPPSTDKYGLSAERLKMRYGLYAAASALYFGFEMASGRLPVVSTLGGASGQFSRLVSGYHRFGKIAKGEWQIVDMPKPHKAQEVETTLKLVSLTA